MTDHATPNLPSSDFNRTAAFYALLGFVVRWRDEGWMILERGTLKLEFFADREIDPLASSFGSCLRLDDLDVFYAIAKAAGLPEACTGHPRLHPPRVEPWGGRVGALIDPDGTLLRLIQN
jgi:catechol 2,3-dioxygenase-like lactoylglutathione lyase family enzyme